MELADSSAWMWSQRRGYPELREDFDQRAVAGEIGICDMVRMELLHGAPDREAFARQNHRFDALPQFPITEAEWKRAIDVYGQLAGKGQAGHRAVKRADLLISAAAEAASVAVLHYDRDFEAIAAVTGQPTRWLAPAGSLR